MVPKGMGQNGKPTECSNLMQKFSGWQVLSEEW
jgi:hypothetical protein